MAVNVRGALLDELYYIKASGQPAAVCMSAGVDSHSVLFALMELGVPVTTYSFTLEDRESRDFKYARSTAEVLGVPFTPIYLPTNVQHLKKFLLYAVKNGASSKTDFECMWPMVYLFRKVNEPFIVSATSADSHFALSKKANMHYKDKVDHYRTVVFGKRNTGQRIILKAEAAKLGKSYFTPYDTTRMCSELHGLSWDELNKPQQKQPIRDSFPEYFSRIKTTVHTNLQLGDSGIADHFTKLLDTDWNRWNYKSIKGIYNRLNSGDIHSLSMD